MKKCTKCQLEKPLSEFNKDKHTKTGYTFRCKACIQSINATYVPTAYKICNICHEEKSVKYFHKDKKGLHGVRKACKVCNYEKIKAYRNENPEKRKKTIEKYNKSENAKENNKRYYNSEKAIINRRIYVSKNRKRINEWHKNRRSVAKNHLDAIMSGAIRSSLKLVGASKERRSWETVVGYSLEELKNHIEIQFCNEGLTWEGLGKVWEIDHKRPKSWYTYTSFEDPQFKHCWQLENLQPLTKSKNRKKKDMRSDHPDDVEAGIISKADFISYLQKLKESKEINAKFVVFLLS